MDWKHDPEVQEAIKAYLTKQKDDLGNLLSSLDQYADGSPIFQMLRVFGMFVYRYADNIGKHTEIDAFDLSIAEISNDPAVQSMVGMMVHRSLDRGLNLE
jgi:hypothetical protein